MISIITPLANEEDYVKPFLNKLMTVEGNFELILVDGGSSDGTLREIERYVKVPGNRIRVLESSRGRAIQMNRGAKDASGDILLFLHVDCMIPKDSLRLIENEIYRKKRIGGAFKQTFSDSDIFLRIISTLGNLRSGLTRTFFGDFAIFLRRDVFQEINGYNEKTLLEDVKLCWKARKFGSFTQIDRYVFTSPRKYLSGGKMTGTIIFLLACVFDLLGSRPRFFWRYFSGK